MGKGGKTSNGHHIDIRVTQLALQPPCVTFSLCNAKPNPHAILSTL